MPDKPQNSFGTGSFTIAAWVKTTYTGLMETVVDKSSYAELSPGNGYSLSVDGGKVHFRYGSGWPTQGDHYSNISVNDGAWHFVVAEVCRDTTSIPPYVGAWIYVDGQVTSFPSNSVYLGDIDDSAPLTIGIGGMTLMGPREGQFQGSIDELQLYSCCIGPGAAQILGSSLGYCRDQCSVPPVVSACPPYAVVPLTVLTSTAGPQTFTYTISAGWPGQCNPAPTRFDPVTGIINTSGVSLPCTGSAKIKVYLPAGLLSGQTTCYTITVRNQYTGQCCQCSGEILYDCSLKGTGGSGGSGGTQEFVKVRPKASTPLLFTVQNSGSVSYQSAYSVIGRAADGDSTNQNVSLNGLAPGTPVTGVLSLAPGQTAVIPLQAALVQFQPMTVHDVVLSLNADGRPGMESFASVSMLSVVPRDTTGLQAELAGQPPASGGRAGLLPSGPNPFRDRTEIKFRLPAQDPNVAVEIFDVAGRLVRRLHSGPLPAGIERLSWDGRDGAGQAVSSGIYFVAIRSEQAKMRMLLVRVK